MDLGTSSVCLMAAEIATPGAETKRTESVFSSQQNTEFKNTEWVLKMQVKCIQI